MDSYSERGELSVLFNGTIVDEQEVLAVCLGHLYIGTRQVVRSLTRSGLPPSTGREQALSYIRENFEGLSEETLADFLAKNREQHPVEPDLNPGGRLTCLSDEEFEHIFRNREGWERFRQTFPESDGTLRFSRVGLNRDVTQAMVYAGQQFDWHIGSGGYWLFSKSSGVWAESGRLGTWLS
jgi:hypothetical protein